MSAQSLFSVLVAPVAASSALSSGASTPEDEFGALLASMTGALTAIDVAPTAKAPNAMGRVSSAPAEAVDEAAVAAPEGAALAALPAGALTPAIPVPELTAEDTASDDAETEATRVAAADATVALAVPAPAVALPTFAIHADSVSSSGAAGTALPQAPATVSGLVLAPVSGPAPVPAPVPAPPPPHAATTTLDAAALTAASAFAAAVAPALAARGIAASGTSPPWPSVVKTDTAQTADLTSETTLAAAPGASSQARAEAAVLGALPPSPPQASADLAPVTPGLNLPALAPAVAAPVVARAVPAAVTPRAASPTPVAAVEDFPASSPAAFTDGDEPAAALLSPVAPPGRSAPGPVSGTAQSRSPENAPAPSAPAAAAAATAPPPSGLVQPVVTAAGGAAIDIPSVVAAPVAEVDAPTPQSAPAASAPATTLAASVNATLSTLSHTAIEATAQIAAQITRRLEGRSTRFEMALSPEGLGRVDVSLDIDADGQLSARLAFDNPLAATDLRGRADELRRQLEDAGFTLSRDALDFAERDSTSGQGFDRRQGRAFAEASRRNDDAEAALPAPAAWTSLSLTPQGVDMKV